MAALARRFTAIVRSRCRARPHTSKTAAVALQRWFDDAHACGVSAVKAFAVALEQDAAAVGAALTTPWSSGQCEGQINKLKLLKRQTYGRASFELLRRRVLLAARSTESEEEPRNRGKSKHGIGRPAALQHFIEPGRQRVGLKGLDGGDVQRQAFTLASSAKPLLPSL